MIERDELSEMQKLDKLLEQTVNVMRGEPPPNVHWSYHDIPELAGLYRAVYVAALQFIGASGWQGSAGSLQYDAFQKLHKAASAVAAEMKRDYEAIRTALKENDA